jgi:predicted nucleic acid-binding protein
MILIDSNIIIYAVNPKYKKILDFLNSNELAVSDISRLEVLGYHKLLPENKIDLEFFFEYCSIKSISKEIIDKAIDLRKIY